MARRKRTVHRTLEEQERIRDAKKEEYLREEARLAAMRQAPKAFSLHSAGGDTTDYVVVGANPETGMFDVPVRMVKIPEDRAEDTRKAITTMNVWFDQMSRKIREDERKKVVEEFRRGTLS